jgi:hypothetical protein
MDLTHERLDALKCHTTSQVVRMFAFELKQIKPDDIIIMSDADAFPSNVHVLNPLFSHDCHNDSCATYQLP